MMDIAELRIGNYVTYQGELAKVDGVWKSSVLLNISQQEANATEEDVTPIVLNDFLLGQLFSMAGNGKWYVGRRAFFLLVKDSGNCYNICCNDSGKEIHMTTAGICFYHQLQNLLLMMFGQEIDDAKFRRAYITTVNCGHF